MGRRKIEIKAIKDDRNRSVTFLKRKGGLFKKAHELSVLCSVDVAVFIFGSNKKLYEYSSSSMPELINRYTFHGGPNEHKGPSDFNGGADDEEEDDENGTPPQADGMDAHMIPPHFQAQPPFPHIRNHTPSASPPIQNGVFAPHPAIARGHTPQPQIGSRPSSRNDIRRMGPGMMPQPTGPPPTPPVNGYAFMPQPAIYNPQNAAPMPPQNMPHALPQQHPQFPYAPPQSHAHHQMQPYMEDQRRSSLPPNFPPQGPQGAPAPRHSVSPPQPPSQQLPPQQLPPQQLPPQPIPHMSPPPPQIHHPMQSPPQPQQHGIPPPQEPQPPAPAPIEPKSEALEIPRQSLLLNTAAAIKKLPQRKQGGSIFTPIDENNSIFSHHQAVFHGEPKVDLGVNRSQSLDGGKHHSRSPPIPQHSGTTQTDDRRNGSMASIPETTFTPPSRSNSLRSSTAGVPGVARPRLKVQIPDEQSDGGSATAESGSPRASTDATSHPSRRPTDSHSSGVVLPPPSPSASALLSAGASGPPNPFARPLPHQTNNNVDTPGSALPSRFVNSDFLPSPNSFYPEWNFRSNDSNTLPSPLNFATPVVGTGPSFLREEATPHKRKSPEISGHGHAQEGIDHGNEPKRVRVDS
ncbi:hypothetical protein GQ53DRAFT_816385 [Thozetella sp. PMI_491]|nr:hypothetical protein GQ53DRAFT_816385 [Thozetella sp. PMI_491]